MRSRNPKRVQGRGLLLATTLGTMQLFASGTSAQGLLIPASTRRDHVFSPGGETLYFTAGDGQLHRFDTESRSLLPSIAVGVSLNAIDVSPDGQAVVLTDRHVVNRRAFVHKVLPASGEVISSTYGLGNFEDYSWDVVVMTNGRALVTNSAFGSAFMPVREYNLASDVISARSDMAGSRGRSRLYRSADRSRAVLLVADSSGGPVHDYYSEPNSFSGPRHVNEFLDFRFGALSRDGELFALERGFPNFGLMIRDRQFNLITTLPTGNGYMFDPVRDLLYVANPISDQILAYRTSDWQIDHSFPIGEDVSAQQVFGAGGMSVSSDGEWLALSTPQGIRLFNIPSPGAFVLTATGMGFVAFRRCRPR